MSGVDADGDLTRIWVKTEIKYEPPNTDEINVFDGEDNVQENGLGDDDPMKYLKTKVELDLKVESVSEVEDKKQEPKIKDEKPKRRKKGKFLCNNRTSKRFYRGKKLQCECCPYQTGRVNRMSSHMKTHSDEKDLSCRFCDYKTNYASSLNRHETSHHGNGDPNFVRVRRTHERKFRCQVSKCYYVARHRNALKTHVATHSKEKPYKCGFCEYSTKFRTALKRHEKTLHKNREEFKCELCDYRTSMENNMKNHIQSHYNNYFICKMCEYKTVLENMFKIHMEQHEAGKNEISADDSKENIDDVITMVAQKITAESIITSTEKTLQPKDETKTTTMPKTTEQCPHCDYKSSNRSHLKTHLWKHSNDKEFKCDLCNYETKHPTALKRHLKTRHPDDNLTTSTKKKRKPKDETKKTEHKCPHCDYKSSNRQHLKTHLWKHSNNMEFKCDFCEYETKHPSALRRHLKTQHTGDK